MARKQKQKQQKQKKIVPTESAPLGSDLLEEVEKLNKLLFDPATSLREGALAVNKMLVLVENILLSAFFKEYERWIRESGGDIEELPQNLTTLGEKVHRLIVARGKFILEILQQIQREEAEKAGAQPQPKTPAEELFTLPEHLAQYLEEEGEDE